jgi:hypothetical protein
VKVRGSQSFRFVALVVVVAFCLASFVVFNVTGNGRSDAGSDQECDAPMVGGTSTCVVVLDGELGASVRIKRFGLSGKSGVLWFVAGGPGDSAVDAFGEDPTETLSPDVLSGFGELLVADVRGVSLPRPVGCSFSSNVNRPVFCITLGLGLGVLR